MSRDRLAFFKCRLTRPLRSTSVSRVYEKSQRGRENDLQKERERDAFLLPLPAAAAAAAALLGDLFVIITGYSYYRAEGRKASDQSTIIITVSKLRSAVESS